MLLLFRFPKNPSRHERCNNMAANVESGNVMQGIGKIRPCAYRFIAFPVDSLEVHCPKPADNFGTRGISS